MVNGGRPFLTLSKAYLHHVIFEEVFVHVSSKPRPYFQHFSDIRSVEAACHEHWWRRGCTAVISFDQQKRGYKTNHAMGIYTRYMGYMIYGIYGIWYIGCSGVYDQEYDVGLPHNCGMPKVMAILLCKMMINHGLEFETAPWRNYWIWEDSLKNWDQYHKPGEHVKPGPHGSLMHSIFPADQLGIGVLQVHVLPGSPTLWAGTGVELDPSNKF